MGGRIRRGGPEAQQQEAVKRRHDLEAHSLRMRRAQLEHELLLALAAGGQAAYALWQGRRAELVAAGLVGADVVITSSAWIPQPATRPHPEPRPPRFVVVEAARIAAELLAERPSLTREERSALSVYLARLRRLHQEPGWKE